MHRPETFAETVTFGGSDLDRAEDWRRNPDALDGVEARVIPLWRGKPLMDHGRQALVQVPGDLFASLGHPILIGRDDDGAAILARDVSALEVDGVDGALGAFLDPSVQTHRDLPVGSVFAELRGAMTALTPRDAEIAATARGVLEWHRTHGFCSNCGAATRPVKAGWSRACDGCGRQHFPRTDPVVIMLVTHGNDCLLGRSPAWPERFFSCLAGFMEPGETMEGAVRREVWEETGVRVGPVSYVSSQPWPFPHSLMIGAWGEARTREITIDPEEIAEARWVSREVLLDVAAGLDDTMTPARPGAIARFLLDGWLAGRVGS